MSAIAELFLDNFWTGVVLGLALAYAILRRRVGRAGVWMLLAIPLGLTLLWGVAHFVDSDEAEHLHAAFLISQGQLPYVDFWQNHTPMTWILLAPLLDLLPASSAVIYLSRLLALVLSGINLFAIWRMSRACWGRTARFDLTLLVFVSGGIVAQVFWLRPDVFMIALCHLSLWVAVLGLQRASARHLLFSGALLALGLSFSTKLVALVLVVPFCASVLCPGRMRRLLRFMVAYGVGVLIGLLPLVLYLWRNDLIEPFYRWSIQYNRRPLALRLDYVEAWIPILIVALLGLGILSFAQNRKRLREPGALVPSVAFVLIALSTILIYPVQIAPFCYYLAPLIGIAAVHASGVESIRLSRFEAPVKAALIGLLFCVLSYRGFSSVRNLFAQDAFLAKNLEFVQWMIDHSRNEAVLCRVPHHPIFALDLTPFAVRWQYIHLIEHPDSPKARMLEVVLPEGEWFEREMLTRRPAIVSRLTYSELVQLMMKHETVDTATLLRLREFLRREYVTVAKTLYLRRDLVRGGDDVGTVTSP